MGTPEHSHCSEAQSRIEARERLEGGGRGAAFSGWGMGWHVSLDSPWRWSGQLWEQHARGGGTLRQKQCHHVQKT